MANTGTTAIHDYTPSGATQVEAYNVFCHDCSWSTGYTVRSEAEVARLAREHVCPSVGGVTIGSTEASDG